jgi:hypothetical protein
MKIYHAGYFNWDCTNYDSYFLTREAAEAYLEKTARTKRCSNDYWAVEEIEVVEE